MYIPTGIEQLSHEQIRKLLKGQGVRVKKGANHTIHLSKEQHKKLMKASHKGAGITLSLDPYQMDGHECLRGEGIFSSMKNIAKSVAKNPLAQSLGKQAIQMAVQKAQASGYVPTGVADMAGKYAEDALVAHAGTGFFDSVKKAAKSVAKNPLAQQLGKQAIQMAVKQAESTGYVPAGVADMAGRYAESQLAKAGTGLHRRRGKGFFDKVKKGIKSVASNPIVKALAKEAIHYGAPLTGEAVGSMLGGPAGAMVGQQLASQAAASQGYGLKRHKKRAGKRGGALFAAGYGMDGYDMD